MGKFKRKYGFKKKYYWNRKRQRYERSKYWESEFVGRKAGEYLDNQILKQTAGGHHSKKMIAAKMAYRYSGPMAELGAWAGRNTDQWRYKRHIYNHGIRVYKRIGSKPFS